MSIIGITSAFLSIRKDRPIEYYSTPLEDFLHKAVVEDPSMPFLVFSDQPIISSLQEYRSIQIEYSDPVKLLNEFWPDKNWMSHYLNLKRLPSLDELYTVNGIALLSVWLGKFAMLKKGFDLGFEAMFWFDAGHWTSHQYFADFSKYSKSMMDSLSCSNLSKRLLSASQKYGVLSTQAWPSLKELHIPLNAYYVIGREMGYQKPETLPLYQGVFLLIHRSFFESFFAECQKWWIRLIDDGYGGTEESALTLFGWQNRIDRLSYNNWLKVLEGLDITDDLLENNFWE